MTSHYKKLAIGIFASLTVPALVYAQTATTTRTTATTTASTTPRTGVTATLIASVDIPSHNVTIATGTVQGNFTLVSKMGNQDNASYGLVVRSKKTGSLLFASQNLGTLALKDGVLQIATVTYSLPPVSEDGIVFINVANKDGVTLASRSVGEVTKSSTSAPCEVGGTSLTCKSTADATLTVAVSSGGPQGEVVGRQSFSLTGGKSQKVTYADLLKNLPGGAYLISGEVSEQGKITQAFSKDYFNPGQSARIMSVTVSASTSTPHLFTATVLTQLMLIIGSSASSSAQIVASSSCLEDKITTSVEHPVVQIPLTTNCKEGTVDLALMVNGSEMDHATTTFSLPFAPENTNKLPLVVATIVVVFSLLAIYLIIRFMHKRVTPTAPVVVAVLLFIGLVTTSDRAHADTYYIAGGAQITFCFGGGGCADTEAEYAVSGTVNIPYSAAPNEFYNVTLWQNNPGIRTGTGDGLSLWCRDYAGEDPACDSVDVITYVYRNGGYLGSIAHTSSYSQTIQMPASGNDNFTLHMEPFAPAYMGCNPSYSGKCNGPFIDPESFAITVHAAPPAPPQVNVYFSFLKDLISSTFAAQ